MFDLESIVWFILGVGLVLAEFAVPGLIVIFFGLGALTVSLLLVLGVPLGGGWTYLLFALFSLGYLFTLRKYFGGIFRGRIRDQGTGDEDEDFLGREGVVDSGFGESSPRKGRIRFRGTLWDARVEGPLLGWERELEQVASPQGTLHEGDTVRIIGREGALLVVEK